jgi:excisionase family DNA binding protein
MAQDTFTPQEAAVATGASLSLVQKLITSKQIPTVGDGSRRRLSRAAVLAVALSRQLPRGIKMTPAEAHEHLAALSDGRLDELIGELELGETRIDLQASLGATLQRLDLLARGAELVTRNAGSGARVIKGLGIDADDLLGRVQAGEPPSTLIDEYPGMDAKAIDAIALWVEANPPRGRPRRAREQLAAPAPRDLGAWTRTMQITARQIHEWAAGRAAAGALPRLVRRLALPVGDVTEVTIPAGDSVARSGWDGELVSVAGNAWVPAGRSFWEMSCEASVTSKANDDYDKRTKRIPADLRASSTLVIVTARRWSQKTKWVEEKRMTGDWGQIRALDADDLEAWLEHTPAVALWFADELGLTGPGVESPARFWEGWAHQADPQISQEALFVDRERGRAGLLAALKQRISGGGTDSITVKADSAEEAAAFACAVLLGEPELSAVSLVVTDVAGWRFVEQNPLLKIVVVARPELAERPSQRAGLAVVVPYAAGDMNAQRGGEQADIVLERPLAHEFEQALCGMSADPADAKRWAATTGRSWSVFRTACHQPVHSKARLA